MLLVVLLLRRHLALLLLQLVVLLHHHLLPLQQTPRLPNQQVQEGETCQLSLALCRKEEK
jgi:hypothetical protein